ncbi:hypothetical protein [Coxiella burnetii]|nr:hypothetical protein [Coxiella burnetii]
MKNFVDNLDLAARRRGNYIFKPTAIPVTAKSLLFAPPEVVA